MIAGKQTPLERYEAMLASDAITPDPLQKEVMQRLHNLYLALILPTPTFWQRCLNKKEVAKGLYLWGGVGIGKTLLMDLFFQSLPFSEKKRIHFHRFMAMMQKQLERLQGTVNPLQTIAKNIRRTTRVFCFDEFVVHDITHAMVLAGLLKAMLDEGIVFVITSNVAPDDLYKNGIQRDSFLPAIALIKKHLTPFHVGVETDYRLRAHQQSGVYYTPINEQTSLAMEQHFNRLVAQSQCVWGEAVAIQNREVPVIAESHKVIWLHADVLFQVPRCARDYLEIADCYHIVMVSQLLAIGEEDNNLIRNFINAVDVFYDNHTILILQAQVKVPKLYVKGRMMFEFERTKSRLLEMQTEAYLARAQS